MISIFKRRRPQHKAVPVQISPTDRLIAAHHQLTPDQWAALTLRERADRRDTVAFELREAS